MSGVASMIGRRNRWPRSLIGARWATAAICCLTIGLLVTQHERVAPSRAMVSFLARPHDGGRSIEPRLSGGLAWEPFRREVRASGDQEGRAREPGVYASVVDTAGPVMRGDPEVAPVAQHTNGVALLLTGRTRQALAALTAAAEALNEPGAWHDL